MRYPQYFNKKFHWKTLLLLPVSMLYCLLVYLRRFLYKLKVFKSQQFNVPVIVVGNLIVGGAGKTPLVIYLARYFKNQGFKPGIVSRGYKSTIDSFPFMLNVDTDALVAGDEAILLARRTHCPVVIDPNRVRAIDYLLTQTDCDLVISDDGLQHLAMQRDINIIVEDKDRRHGNGLLLPAGPLREWRWRFKKSELTIFNGKPDSLPKNAGYYTISSVILQRLGNNEQAPETHRLSSLSGKNVHAIAGIGNPERFYAMLRAHGLQVVEHDFSDHHQYLANELDFEPNWPIVMTEKDAVKCENFNLDNAWFVKLEIEPDELFLTNLDQAMAALGLSHFNFDGKNKYGC